MKSFQPDRPFDDLPQLPPPTDLESKAVLKACIEARVAVAELHQSGALIANQAMLINTLPLLEARSSSEIENIVTTSDRLFRQAAPDQEDRADPETKEALRYRAALWRGLGSLDRKPLSTSTAVEVCRTLLGIEVDIRKVPGTTLASESTGQPFYTPPVGEKLIRDLLANWEEFLHQATDIDPLVRMAVGHYQFEAIHPFSDGNGRTGRILNLLYLVEQGLLDLPVLYLSRYVLANRSDYYRYLRRVTTNADWESWLLYMLSAVTETARWTTDRIHRIRHLADATEELIRQKAPTTHSRELVDLLFERPYCRIRDVVDAGIAQRQTASVYLKTLTELGVLDTYKAGREKIFINKRLMHLLTQEDPGPLTF